MSSRTIFLDSDKCSTYDPTTAAWTWLFPESVVLAPRGSHAKAGVVLFSYYNCISNIRAGVNDVLRLTIGSTSYVATVPAGQYSAESLIDALSGQIGSAKILFDENTTTYTIECSTSFTLLSTSTLLSPMGLAAGVATLTSGVYSITSTSLVNLGGIQFLEIESSLQTDNVSNGDVETGLILCRVPCVSPYGSLVVYGGESTIFSTIKTHYLSFLTIRIRDDKGNPVNFNGIPWSMSLYFQAEPNLLYEDLTANYAPKEEKSIEQS